MSIRKVKKHYKKIIPQSRKMGYFAYKRLKKVSVRAFGQFHWYRKECGTFVTYKIRILDKTKKCCYPFYFTLRTKGLKNNKDLVV